ncbi:hypothetical protein C8F01DRAFT_1371307 [Mycena amicta]|nr:hypothetical protein C8F01DRAFT_1371307 [Mycena amicta]
MSSASSVASFTTTSSSSSQKDYSAAFATLQSAYGLGGLAPSLVAKSNPKKLPRKSHAHAPASAAASKSYESAFGALSSKFGTSASSVSKLSGILASHPYNFPLQQS